MTPRSLRIDNFDYTLPAERIASKPRQQRDSCRLLVSLPDASLMHRNFSDICDILPKDSLLVLNDTRVIHARLHFRKPSGAVIEIFLLDPVCPDNFADALTEKNQTIWRCLVGNAKRWKENPLEKTLTVGGDNVLLSADRIAADEGNTWQIKFSWTTPIPFGQIIEAAGTIPIPPYLNREAETSDTMDYQTVYARCEGSVAAPTAGLHFTPELLDKITRKGVKIAPVTLHVGAGTFMPVKSDTMQGHPMHTERFSIPASSLEQIADALKHRRHITAVGTTSVRTLESLPYIARALDEGRPPHTDQWEPYDRPLGNFRTADAIARLADRARRSPSQSIDASTSLMIAPGFNWRIVSAMVTNFHQPRSTLLLLVASFLSSMGMPPFFWLNIYTEALDNGYSFLSYGDACYLTPPNIPAPL